MKILYIGHLGYGSTSQMRCSHLRALGHDVFGLDSTVRTPSWPVNYLIRLSRSLGFLPDTTRINQRLRMLAYKTHPDIVWVDKGITVSLATLRAIRKYCGTVTLIHYNPDDPFGAFGQRGWKTFLRALPEYDVHFVPRRENVTEYTKRGASLVIHNIPTRGFDPQIHRPYSDPNETSKAFASEVGFLGTFESARCASLHSLAEHGFAIMIGSQWPETHLHPNLKRAPYRVKGVEYAQALGSFKIGLCFLRKANRDQHTSRSIEIPACGTFMLAERTAEHQMLFEEAKEAEFFSCDSELLDKVNYYREHDAAREAIAKAGRERCLRSGYDYSSRMSMMLAQALER